MIKKWLFGSIACLLALTACSTSQETSNPGKQTAEAEQASAENKDVTLKIGVTPWTSTIHPTEVARLLLEDMGYKVELQNADVGVIFTALSSHDVDIFMDAWIPIHDDYLKKYKGKIVDTAVSYKNAEAGLAVPAYLKDINSVQDLKGKEDLFDGKVYAIEEGDSSTEIFRQMIKGNDLNMEVVSSSESAMLSQVKKNIGEKKPVIFYGWRPHSMFSNYDLKILKGQEDYMPTGEVHVYTSKELEKKAPEAYALLQNWSMPLEDVEKAIVEVENGKDKTEIAKEWIKNHPDLVKKMKGE